MAAIRVLYVEGGSGWGGSSASLYRLLKVLTRNGVIPVVAARQHGPNIERMQALGIKTVLLPKVLPALPRQGVVGRFLALPRLAMEAAFLIRLCRTDGIQLLHLNTGLASCLPGAVAAKWRGLPCVCHLRGVGTKFMRRMAWRAARWVDMYLSVSSLLPRVYGLDRFKPPEAVRTIYDGIDLSDFRPDPHARVAQRLALGISHSDCVVGMVARFVQSKAQDRLVLAAHQILQKRGDVVFLFVGSGGAGNDVDYERSVREQTHALSLREHVKFVPWQSDVRPLLMAMDLVVLPSMREGLPLCLVEAMALDKPVVATKVGGVPELVRDGQEGLLVPPGDVPSLAAAIEELVADEERRHQMSVACRRRVEEVLSIDRVAGAVLETYEWLRTHRQNTFIGRLKEGGKRVVRRFPTISEKMVHVLPCRRGQFTVLMYHRISKRPDPYFPGISEATLERQLAFLKRYYAVLPLGEAVKRVKEGKPLSRRSVCLTFDDGLWGTRAYAFPNLVHHHLPATVFLATGAVGSQHPIWTDRVVLGLSRYQGETLAIAANGIFRTFRVGSLQERLAAIQSLKEWLKQIPDHERRAVVDRLTDGISLPLQEHETSVMKWEQVTAMARAGVEFGAHTVNHPILSRVDLQEAKWEIETSKEAIEQVLRKPIRYFAYPNGERGDFGPEHETLVAEAGFDCACSTIFGLNDRKTHRYALRRIDAREEPLSHLAARLAGLGS